MMNLSKTLETLVRVAQAQEQALTSEGPQVDRDLVESRRELFGVIAEMSTAAGVVIEDTWMAKFLPHDWRARAQ